MDKPRPRDACPFRNFEKWKFGKFGKLFQTFQILYEVYSYDAPIKKLLSIPQTGKSCQNVEVGTYQVGYKDSFLTSIALGMQCIRARTLRRSMAFSSSEIRSNAHFFGKSYRDFGIEI